MVAAEATVAATSTTQTVQADQLIACLIVSFSKASKPSLLTVSALALLNPFICLQATHDTVTIRIIGSSSHMDLPAQHCTKLPIGASPVRFAVNCSILVTGMRLTAVVRSNRLAFEAVENYAASSGWLLSPCGWHQTLKSALIILPAMSHPIDYSFAEASCGKSYIAQRRTGWPPRAWRFAQRLAVYYRQPLPDTALFKLAGAAMIRRGIISVTGVIMTTTVYTLALVINPYAGIGGAVALKGSDGAETRQQALARGAVPKANQRVAEALTLLQPYREQVRFVTASGAMGPTC